jgi:hypothetical protein
MDISSFHAKSYFFDSGKILFIKKGSREEEYCRKQGKEGNDGQGGPDSVSIGNDPHKERSQ